MPKYTVVLLKATHAHVHNKHSTCRCSKDSDVDCVCRCCNVSLHGTFLRPGNCLYCIMDSHMQ